MEMLQLFEYIEDNGLTPNQYYLLWSIKNKRVPKGINIILEKKILTSEGYMDDKVNISEKGNNLLDLISKNVAPAKIIVKEFDVDQYLNIFPKIKLPSNKPARVNKRVISDCFSWFFKNYDYDWLTVVKATAMYVDEFESKNYLYMRNSQYFIRKQNADKTWDSELANYCDMIINGLDDSSHHFSENVV